MPLDQLGRYEVTGELGRGAMGVVYKAQDPLLDRTVAIKTIGLGLTDEESDAFEQRFYREAKSAGRLNHVNIVTIHDVGKSGDIAYIAMEFLQGRSLREIMDSGAVLPPDKIADIAAQVADGLAFAHEHEIVHRDIKPANIMLLDNGVVKITDFGIALLPAGSRTMSGRVFGSPKYISPEQVEGRQVDGRSDIFALGAVLYEMLTGTPPFMGTDLNTILYKVINTMPAAPSSFNKSLAPAFDLVVARALAKLPEDRYGNAREMASELRSIRILPISASKLLTQVQRQASRVPGDATVSLDIGPAVSQTRVDLPQPAALASDTRRKLVIYGAPAALLAILGGWAIARRAANHSQPAVQTATPVAAPVVDAPRNTGIVEAAAASEPPRAPAPAAAVMNETPATAKPMARLALAVTPWGEVYVDGKKKGVSPPLKEIMLAPGPHMIEIRNTTFQPYTETVNLGAAARAKIRHKFQ
jgi:eukaryotic-like serine/threonine-protein kinase